MYLNEIKISIIETFCFANRKLNITFNKICNNHSNRKHTTIDKRFNRSNDNNSMFKVAIQNNLNFNETVQKQRKK